MGCPADARGAHKGHRRAVRALLRDGQHFPAVQDLRGARQGRENRALRTLALHALSHRLAGSSAFSDLISTSFAACRINRFLLCREFVYLKFQGILVEQKHIIKKKKKKRSTVKVRNPIANILFRIPGLGRPRMSILPGGNQGHGVDCRRSVRSATDASAWRPIRDGE